MKVFLLLLVVLGGIHAVIGESIVPGLLTGIAGGLLAVMAWLDGRGEGAEGAIGIVCRAWRGVRVGDREGRGTTAVGSA
jgi:hypothetical protein